MKTENKISERVQVGLRIPEPDYSIGLVYLVNCIYLDYFKLISEEKRNRGIMLHYQSKINNAFLEFFKENMTEELYDLCGRIVFLYRNVIYSEFKYLNKRLSPADRVIVVIRRLLEFIDNKSDLGKDQFFAEIKEITINLHNNIRWGFKNAKLKRLNNVLTLYFEEGFVGKQCIFNYSLIEEEKKYENRQVLDKSKTLMEDSNTDNITIKL